MRARTGLALGLVAVVAMALPSLAQAAGPLSWSSPRVADRQVPFGHWQYLAGVACPSTSLCVTVGGDQLLTSTAPALGAGAWSAYTVPGAQSLNAIACPSVSLCVATDFSGHVLTSTNPTGGPSAWKTTSINSPQRFGGMYCPSVSLCMTTDFYGDLAVSTNPTGGASAWNVFSVAGGRLISAISCPSVSLCVASDSGGYVASSTDPAGGSSAWKEVLVESPPSHALDSVSCPTTTLCVAGGSDGDVVTTTDPTGPATAWRRASVDPGRGLGVSCPSVNLCLGVDGSGYALGTKYPLGGGPKWSVPVAVDPPLVCGTECEPTGQQVTCPSASLCVMADAYGRGFVSTDPGEARWTPVFDRGADTITHLDCPTADLCVGTDDRARILSSANPAGGNPSWDAFPAAGGGLQRLAMVLACHGGAMCLALRINPYGVVEMISSRRPGQGPSAWHTARKGSINLTEIDAMSCPSRRLCVAATYFKGVYLTTNPAGGRPHWRHVPIRGSHELRSISCPSTHFCAAANNRGDVFTSRHPGGRSPRWHRAHIDSTGGSTDFGSEPVHALIALSRPSSHLCVAVDHAGNVFSSSHPGGGAHAWKQIKLGFDPPGGLSCPSSALCVLPAPGGVVYASRTPTGAASSWTSASVDPGGTISAVSCASARLCFLGDSDGNVIVGRAGG